MDRLLSTAKSSEICSRNLALLSAQFHEHRSNHRLFLSGSSLYHWAGSDAWRQNPTSTRCCEHSSVEFVDVVGPEEEDEQDDDDIEEPADLGHDLDSGQQRHAAAIYPSRIEQDTQLSLPLAPVNEEEVRRRQLSAKLHCLYGIPIQEVRKQSTTSQRYALRSDTAPIHPYARSKVYDLRQHTDGSLWGPFLDDGSQDVDWEKMEAVMLILHRNMKLFAEGHEVSEPSAIPASDEPFGGAHPYSYVPRKADIPKQPKLPLEAQDPYNITGTWMRVVCFLDYTELFDFNFAGHRPPPGQPRPALDTVEAIRLITMRLIVTKLDQPGEEEGKGLPVVHFKGISSSVRPSWDPNANSKIRGNRRSTL